MPSRQSKYFVAVVALTAVGVLALSSWQLLAAPAAEPPFDDMSPSLCSQMEQAEAESLERSNDAKRALLRKGATNPGQHGTVHFSFVAPLGVSEAEDIAAALQMTDVTASFPGFTQGTNFTTTYRFNENLSAKENLDRWSSMIDGTIRAVEGPAGQESTEEVVLLKNRLDRGEFPIVAMRLSGSNRDLGMTLQRHKSKILSVGYGENPPALPFDEASQQAKDRACNPARAEMR